MADETPEEATPEEPNVDEGASSTSSRTGSTRRRAPVVTAVAGLVVGLALVGTGMASEDDPVADPAETMERAPLPTGSEAEQSFTGAPARNSGLDAARERPDKPVLAVVNVGICRGIFAAAGPSRSEQTLAVQTNPTWFSAFSLAAFRVSRSSRKVRICSSVVASTRLANPLSKLPV